MSVFLGVSLYWSLFNISFVKVSVIGVRIDGAAFRVIILRA